MLRHSTQFHPLRMMSTSSKPVLLSTIERSELLPTVPKWKPNAEQTSITRALKFSNFNEAWGFMSRVALRAERLNHHPDWRNVCLFIELSWSRCIMLLILRWRHIPSKAFRNGISRWRSSLIRFRRAQTIQLEPPTDVTTVRMDDHIDFLDWPAYNGERIKSQEFWTRGLGGGISSRCELHQYYDCRPSRNNDSRLRQHLRLQLSHPIRHKCQNVQTEATPSIFQERAVIGICIFGTGFPF